MKWTFVIPDEPIPTGRPRVTVRGGRPHAYQPARTAQGQWNIRTFVTRQLGSLWVPLECPIKLSMTAFVSMPKSIPKKYRETAVPAKRPDLDNYIKQALDGCSPIWKDDSQVVEIYAAKKYTPSFPRWEIIVATYSDQPSA